MMRWNNTKTYTEEDIMRMQQEAVSRVHEFQLRANQASSYYDVPTIGEAHEPYDPEAVIEAQSRVVEPPVPVQETPVQPHHQPTDPISGILEKFNIDSETLLILGLLFVLYNEKADSVLLLALAYLLL